MEADVVKLVDTLVLGTSALSREGSSPFIRTNKEKLGCNTTGLSVGMQPPQGPPHMQRMGGNPSLDGYPKIFLERILFIQRNP